MKLLYQPEGSSTCGQHCVAMIAGITAQESLAVFASKGCTSTKKVAAALRSLGFASHEKLQRFTDEKQLPKVCILKLRWANSSVAHWVVYNRGIIYDSVFGKYPFAEKEFKRIKALVPKSYLQIDA